jgi:proton-dependent oligopeptide transporter, POT family
MANSSTPAIVAGGLSDTGFFGHPRGLSTLFFTELWERFSYYGMRALLILFMIAPEQHAGLGFPVPKAGAIYGLYTAMVYLLSLPGGWLADQFLGQRRAVLYGGIIIALGHFSLAIPSVSTFYSGLTLIVLGTGLLKPNVSTMVGQLYHEHDHRRDAGFSIFYMGINLGALVAPLICGYLGEKVNWHYGFAMAGIGMTVGLLQYVLRGKNLGSVGLRPGGQTDPAATLRHRRTLKLSIVGIAVAGTLLIGLNWLGILSITPERVANAGGMMLLTITVAFFVWLFAVGKWTPLERKRLIAVLILFIAAAAFWANYEQAGSTLNLFAKRNTRLEFLGFSYPASWFQSLNSLFIMVLAPFFAWLWIRLGPKDPSSPAKFAGGLIFVALGFLVLVPVAGGGRVSPIWLILCYFFQTVGELLLSPVGLSAMTKLAPPRIVSLTMGAWFLADSVGNYIGGLWASVYETFPLPMLFGLVGLVSLAVGALLLLFLRPIKNLMGGAD